MLGCLTIRMICNSRFCGGERLAVSSSTVVGRGDQGVARRTYFEALILEHTFDGSIFAVGRDFCLENDTERTIADYFALGVLHLLRLSGQAILDLFTNNLCG